MENTSFYQVELPKEMENECKLQRETEGEHLVRSDLLPEEKPEIVPLHISCSQRPDWNCGPCKAYGVKKPWELV
ncbi:MAG: hypothetical protein KKA99_06225 [Gammaproteobacteria bacterium]|nr:hypothetical protein [Gammaproteobacteria bacterium]